MSTNDIQDQQKVVEQSNEMSQEEKFAFLAAIYEDQIENDRLNQEFNLAIDKDE